MKKNWTSIVLKILLPSIKFQFKKRKNPKNCQFRVLNYLCRFLILKISRKRSLWQGLYGQAQRYWSYICSQNSENAWRLFRRRPKKHLKRTFNIPKNSRRSSGKSSFLFQRKRQSHLYYGIHAWRRPEENFDWINISRIKRCKAISSRDCASYWTFTQQKYHSSGLETRKLSFR